MTNQEDNTVLDVTILDYTPALQEHFKNLNVEWIETYFKLEEKDLQTLNNPQSYIIDKGGQILFALYQEEIVATCALAKIDETTYELAKMAVSPRVQGKGIGKVLATAAIEKARQIGARKIFLESNSNLKPALSLYYKLGFKQVFGIPSPYQRADIQMELVL